MDRVFLADYRMEAAPLPVKREREAEPEEGNGRRYKMVKLDNGKAAVDLTED